MGQHNSTHSGARLRRRSLKQITSCGLSKRSTQNLKGLSHAFSVTDGAVKVNLLNINTATEEELMTLPGTNRVLAKNIVNHRRAIGRFHRVEDLALVSGIGAHHLELIRPEICVWSGDDSQISSKGTPPSPWNKPQAASTPVANGIDRIPKTVLPRMNGVSKTSVTQKSEFCTGISEEDIWELLSVASPRPPTPSNFTNRLQGRSSVRIATWNLDSFSADKAANPGVKEVVCRTILENRFSILALQEIENAEALLTLTLELNTPSLKRVRDWSANRRTWRSSYLGGGLAILWNADAKIGISLREQERVSPDSFPLAVSVGFYINELKVTLFNVRSCGARDKKIIQQLGEREHSVILGDFSCLADTDDLDRVLSSTENSALYSEDLFFNDNILWGKDSKNLMNTDICGIVRQGLTHLGIPRGWKWGGPASSHCPVWCQIFSQHNEQ